ncbi:hypothetical protein [Okeania sp. SIO3B5]|nr:hypothetical protein [Okeania sp. SIO3B5]
MFYLLLSNSYYSTHKAIAVFRDGLMFYLLLSNSYYSALPSVGGA